MLFSKVDVRPIIKGHISTLRDNTFGKKVIREDAALFGIFPALCGIVLVLLRFRFRVDAVNGFLNVFAILTGLLLNLLVLVMTLTTVTKDADALEQAKKTAFIKQIFRNICFAVLIAVTVVCIALVALSYMRSEPGATTGPGATFLLCALTTNFILTLVMILKRIYVLIDKDFRTGSSSQSRAA